MFSVREAESNLCQNESSDLQIRQLVQDNYFSCLLRHSHAAVWTASVDSKVMDNTSEHCVINQGITVRTTLWTRQSHFLLMKNSTLLYVILFHLTSLLLLYLV